MELYDGFINCMAAFLNRTQPTLPNMTATEWGKLYTLAKRQSLTGALYTAVAKNTMPDPVADRLRRDGYVTLMRYEEQTAAKNEIAALFTAQEIPHLFFKGAVTRRYYPVPAMRSMGDIDMAIRLADRDRAEAAMRGMGYDVNKEEGDVWKYTKGAVLVEIHTVVRRYNAAILDSEVYDDIWTDARLQSGATYHLSDEAEAAMAVAHLASHFCGGGSGLRQLMDVAVLYKHFPDKDFWQGVLTRLEPLHLSLFGAHLLWLCNRLFATAVPDELTQPLDEDTAAQFALRFVTDGTFGTDDRRMIARLRSEQRQKRGKASSALRFLFPKPAYIRRRYGYAADHPVLLPVAYGHRLWDGITKNRKRHENRLRYAKENIGGLEDEITFFETIGL